MEIEDIRRRLGEALSSDPDVAAVYLFGSFARREAGVQSDVDLAILRRRRPASTLEDRGFDLADHLTEALGHPVDVVVLNDAPVDLVHRVLRDGLLLVENDASARVRFEVAARNAYFDLLPHLERYRRGARP